MWLSVNILILFVNTVFIRKKLWFCMILIYCFNKLTIGINKYNCNVKIIEFCYLNDYLGSLSNKF